MPFSIRILDCPKRVSVAAVEQFKAIPVANVSDNMLRITAAGVNIRPMHAGGVLAGPAFTVKSRPGDNLLLHKALDLAQPGDVVVVDAGGDLTNSLLGEMMAAHAKTRGLAGVIINGAIRDYGSLHASHFPIYAAGVTHRGPYKEGPGEINVSVAIAGMIVEPGDLILGDDDGVVCVPRDAVEEVYQASKKKHEDEVRQLAEILHGTSDRSWVDARLRDLGYQIKRE